MQPNFGMKNVRRESKVGDAEQASTLLREIEYHSGSAPIAKVQLRKENNGYY